MLTAAYNVTRGIKRVSSPMQAPASMVHPAPTCTRSPIRAPSAITQSGPMHADAAMRASGATTALG